MVYADERAGPEGGHVRILIADDHPWIRAGLMNVLQGEPGFDVVGVAINGRDAVEQAAELRPDVVVMDVTMPRLNGIDATREILARCPGAKVVGLSMHEGESMLPRMLDAGAVAYVEKSAPPDELVCTIRRVCGLDEPQPVASWRRF